MTKEIDPQDLLALEEARAEQEKTRQQKRQREIEDFKWLMGTVQGRRFVWRLLEKAGVFRSTFRPDSEMVFLEGLRNMGLLLIADIHETCPEKYHVMVREQEDNDR